MTGNSKHVYLRVMWKIGYGIKVERDNGVWFMVMLRQCGLLEKCCGCVLNRGQNEITSTLCETNKIRSFASWTEMKKQTVKYETALTVIIANKEKFSALKIEK